VRKRTAEAMVNSAFTAPHVTEFLTIDATATMDLVAKLKTDRDFADVRVTPLRHWKWPRVSTTLERSQCRIDCCSAHLVLATANADL